MSTYQQAAGDGAVLCEGLFSAVYRCESMRFVVMAGVTS